MNKNDVHCAHACRNTCAMLAEAVDREKELFEFYNALAAECDYPDVQAVITDAIRLKTKTIETLQKQLEDMHVRGEVLDGVKSSFDPAGC